MNILKSAALIAAGLLLLAGCQKAAQDTAAEVSEIQKISESWGASYNAGNADAVANLYTEDAVVLPPGAPAANGRAEIREFIAGDTAAAKAAGLTFNVTSDASAIHVSGDTAWQNGTFMVTDASGATVATGKYLSVFQKADGKWMLLRDTWNTDSAPAPAPAAEAASEPAAS